MWYAKKTTGGEHRNALAHLSYDKFTGLWRLRFYWKQYISGTLQRDIVHHSLYKEWCDTKKQALHILDIMGYIESSNQDRHIPGEKND